MGYEDKYDSIDNAIKTSRTEKYLTFIRPRFTHMEDQWLKLMSGPPS